MKYKTIFFLILYILTILSCDTLLESPSPKNAEKAIDCFYADTLNQKYSQDQIKMMETLSSLLISKDKLESTIGVNVNSMNYDTVVLELTEFFDSKDISYESLLSCVDVFIELSDQKKQDLEEVGEKVQEECKKRQNEVSRISKILSESMTSTVTGPYSGHNEANGSYVEFKIVDKNLTNKMITGRKTFIEFYNGFNKRVHTVNLTGNNGFRKSDVGYLRYSKNENAENYKKFADLKPGSFSIKTKNKILNIGGDLIQYPAYTNMDFEYEVYSSSSTYCPYIEFSKNTEPFRKEVEDLEEKYKKKLYETCEGLGRLVIEYLPLLKSK